MNYKDLGYDDNLGINPNSPLFVGTSSLDYLEGVDSAQILKLGRISSPNGKFYLDFDKNHLEVDEVNWSRGYGGNLTLGGKNNVNGTFSLNDETDTEKISMDKDGIIINGGAMTIKDENNTTIVDASGLVSTANFAYGQAFNNSEVTMSGSNTADIANTSINFSLLRTTNALISFTISAYNTNGAEGVVVSWVDLDGSQVGQGVVVSGVAGAIPNTSSASFIIEIPSGDHILKLRWRGNTPDNVVLQPVTNSFSAILYYVLLGN